jgi:hypothetical protein
MSGRGLALIAAALVLSAGLLGVQLASGGADFVPQRTADPCRDRGGPPIPPDFEAIGEAVVLVGLDEAACELGVSRERLLLAVPSRQDRAELARELGTDERGLATAIRDGLRTGVDRLEKGGRLPRSSALLPAVADELGVPRGLVDLIPDSLVEDLLPTAGVLRRSLDRLDVDDVLANLDDQASLESTLRDAIVRGALDEAKARIREALPAPLRGLLD